MSQEGAVKPERAYFSETGQGIDMNLAATYQVALREYADDKLVTTGMLADLLFEDDPRRNQFQSRICQLIRMSGGQEAGNIYNSALSSEPNAPGCRAFPFYEIKRCFEKPRIERRGQVALRLCEWLLTHRGQGRNHDGHTLYRGLRRLNVDLQVQLVEALEENVTDVDARIAPWLKAIRELSPLGRQEFLNWFGEIGDYILRELQAEQPTQTQVTSNNKTTDKVPEPQEQTPAATENQRPNLNPLETEPNDTSTRKHQDHAEDPQKHVAEKPLASSKTARVIPFPVVGRPTRMIAAVALIACCLLAVAAGIRYYTGNEIMDVLWRFGSPEASKLTPDPSDLSARLRQAYSLYHQGKNIKAESAFHKLKADSHKNPKIKADCDQYLGVIHTDIGDYESATLYFQLAINYYRSVGYQISTFNAMNEYARNQTLMGELDKAKNLLLQSKSFFDASSLPNKRNLLAQWLEIRYSIAVFSGEYSQALNLAEEIFLHTNLKGVDRGYAYCNLALSLSLNKRKEEAESYIQFAEEIFNTIGSERDRNYLKINHLAQLKCGTDEYNSVSEEVRQYALKINSHELSKYLEVVILLCNQIN